MLARGRLKGALALLSQEPTNPKPEQVLGFGVQRGAQGPTALGIQGLGSEGLGTLNPKP